VRRVLLVVALFGILASSAAAEPPRLGVAGTLLRADGATVEGTPLTVEPAARDADGIRSIEVTVDGRAVRAARNGVWRIDPADYGDGSHRIVVDATDNAGETTTEEVAVRFVHTERRPPVTLRATHRRAGETVANVGDVDGDGSEDVLVGGRGVASVGRHRFTAEGRLAVAAAGDVNGDGYRDLLIGARRAVYAVFGGPRLRSGPLERLGRAGLTVVTGGRGPYQLATRRLGDFEVDGDVDGDGLDDIALAGPDGVYVANGSARGGVVRARRRFSRASSVAFPGDIDHDGRAEILAAAPGEAFVLYADGSTSRVRGDASGSAGSIGDVDGDSTPDLLLGSAVVFAQPHVDVDLAQPFAGFRVTPPPGATEVVVAGIGDIDGDYAPDAAFGFPALGATFIVYSPLDAPVVDLASLPGDRGARVDGPVASIDGLDAEQTVLIGGDGVRAVPSPRRAETACQPNRLWTFPYTAEHVLPRCRRAFRVVDSPAFNPSPDAGQIARFNPEPACGLPSRTCQPTAYRSGNARIHGPDVGLTTDAIVDLVDSYGTRLAAIQRAGPDCFTVFDRNLTRVGATCDPVGNPPTAHPIDLWVQGRACMGTKALEDAHYLVRLLDPEGAPAAAYRELQGFVRRDRISLGSELTTIGGAVYDPSQLAEAAYTGCGPRPPKREPVPVAFAPTLPGLPSGERLFRFEDRYVSNASFATCEGKPGPPNLDPACYGPLANYQVPTLYAKDPQLPTGDPRAGADWAALTVSTTATSGAGYPSHPGDGQELEAAGGGLVRAIVPRARPFTALDGFLYSDPNVPCDTRRIARWMYGSMPGEQSLTGWTVFRDPQGVRERNGLSPGCP
jgi:hypothetical protein